MSTRFVAGFAAVLFAFTGLGTAFAGTQPSPAPAATAAPNPIPTVPANPGGIVNDAINALSGIVKSVYGWNDAESYGQVTFYRGYDLQLRMQLDRYREIHLHRGTVINPRGYTIKPGDMIDVKGRPQSDGSLDADMIVANPRVP